MVDGGVRNGRMDFESEESPSDRCFFKIVKGVLE